MFKVFIEFDAILLPSYVLVFWLWGMWDLTSPARSRTSTACVGRQNLNHWTAREVPHFSQRIMHFKTFCFTQFLRFYTHVWASFVAQLVKNPPPMRETWVWSLGWEDPLEKGKATHSTILAWRIPWTAHGVAKSQTRLSDFHFHYTPVSVKHS